MRRQRESSGTVLASYVLNGQLYTKQKLLTAGQVYSNAGSLDNSVVYSTKKCCCLML